jgi:DNA-binding response OmpR family regulator
MAVELDLTDRRILIVDDMPAGPSTTGRELQYLRASDGESAIQVAANSKPDLILLDVMMPGIDGYETCRRLKRDDRLASIPVLFLTARDDLHGIVEGFESGGLDYMTKPFRKEEVLSRIRTHLERSVLMHNLADAVEERTRELNLCVSSKAGTGSTSTC